MTIAAQTFERCPQCGRPLHDRRPPNTCPDCGFTYDADTRVWRVHESWMRPMFIQAVLGFALGLGIALIHPAGDRRAAFAIWPLALAIASASLGLLVQRILSGKLSDRFVAITPAGLVVGLRPRPTTIAWDDFDRLTVQRGVLKVQRRSNPALLPLEDVFDGPQDVADFRSAVDAARKRHRNRAP